MQPLQWERRPDGLRAIRLIDNGAILEAVAQAGIADDPLLLLFQTGADLPHDRFHDELRKQRGIEEEEVLSV